MVSEGRNILMPSGYFSTELVSIFVWLCNLKLLKSRPKFGLFQLTVWRHAMICNSQIHHETQWYWIGIKGNIEITCQYHPISFDWVYRCCSVRWNVSTPLIMHLWERSDKPLSNVLSSLWYGHFFYTVLTRDLYGDAHDKCACPNHPAVGYNTRVSMSFGFLNKQSWGCRICSILLGMKSKYSWKSG